MSLADKKSNIDFRLESVENSTLADNSVNLITVSCAIHWFDHEKFYDQVKRVSVQNGVLAFWMFDWPIIFPTIDKLRDTYLYDILEGYWDKRSDHWHAKYKTIPMPFREIETPTFNINYEWDYEQISNFLKSSSAAQVYMDKQGYHPIDHIRDELKQACKEQKVNVTFPLILRAAYINE